MKKSAYQEIQISQFINSSHVVAFHNLDIYTLAQLSDWTLDHNPKDMFSVPRLGMKTVALCVMILQDYDIKVGSEFTDWYNDEFLITVEGSEWYHRHIERKKEFDKYGLDYNYGFGGVAVNMIGKCLANVITSADKEASPPINSIIHAQNILVHYYNNGLNAVATCNAFSLYIDDNSCAGIIADKISYLKEHKGIDRVRELCGMLGDDISDACNKTLRESFWATCHEVRYIEVNRNQAKELKGIAPDLTQEQIKKILKSRFNIGVVRLSVQIPDHRVRLQAASVYFKSLAINAKMNADLPKGEKDQSDDDEFMSNDPKGMIMELLQRVDGTVDLDEIFEEYKKFGKAI